jgi:hypothetical protein
LLDEPWPAAAPAPVFTAAAGAQRFLSAVAEATLDRAALPLHARDFLAKLSAGTFDRVSFLLGNLQSLLAKPATVTRRRRAAALALAPGAAIFASLVMGFMMYGLAARQGPKTTGPRAAEWRQMSSALTLYATVASDEKMAARFPRFGRAPALEARTEVTQAVQQLISGRYAAAIKSAAFEADATAAGLTAQQRALAHAAVAAQPEVTPAQLALAEQTLGPAMRMMDQTSRGFAPYFGPFFFAALLLFIALGSLIGAVVLGRAPILHVLDLAVVDRTGGPARRGRLLGRSALVWGAMLAGWFCVLLMSEVIGSSVFGRNVPFVFFGLALLGFLIGVPWTILRPTAGPHDRLTGTRVVPR